LANDSVFADGPADHLPLRPFGLTRKRR
jgi:hypothetical protein